MGPTPDYRRRETQARERADALAQQTAERRRQQAAALAHLDCIQGVPLDNLLHLSEICTLRTFLPGTVIISERTPGAHLYMVLRGTVTLTLHDRAGRKSLIGVLNRGDCFGEGPLFGDQFRGATVQAETICYLVQIELSELRAFMADCPALEGALRATYRRRLVESTLARIPLFSQLTPVERVGVAELLRPAHYGRGEPVIREGEPGEALYLIESGQAIVTQGGQAIAHLDEGDFFGEISLLTAEPHNADVRTLTPAEVLVLPAQAFRTLLERQPSLGAQLREVVERRRVAGTTVRRDTARSAAFTAAVNRGLLRGTHVLVRDADLCRPDCRLCEDACATRHGSGRIRVHGVLFNGVEVTDSCRQCRVGAECVEVCPEDAIRWNDRGALIITDACTGCGECVSACPYDAVRLAPLDRHQDSPLWQLWRQLTRRSRQTIPLEPARPSHRADKCDLCHGFDDLACVSACPSGALRLVPVEELFPL